MLKLKAGRLAREVPDACLQFWGGMGFTSDVEVSRLYRDNRLLSIGGGADEVMLSIICKYMGTFPKDQTFLWSKGKYWWRFFWPAASPRDLQVVVQFGTC